MPAQKPPVCLTIAGLDPSGGAGVVADIKTFSAFGCYGAAVVSAITFQNTLGVFGSENLSGDSVRRQIEPVFDDFEVAAVKTGMLPTREVIEVVAEMMEKFRPAHFVVDPVVRSTSGFDLIDDQALGALCEMLFPLATLITPNLPEAERIAGFAIESEDAAQAALSKMRSMGAANVLLKGGHQPDQVSSAKAIDRLYVGENVELFEAEFVDTRSTHGTGCTLAAGIAAGLALGQDLVSAVRDAKEFVTDAIRAAPGLGHGNGPIDHLVTRRKQLK